MKSPTPSALDWVERVNRAWLVHGRLNEHSEVWLRDLAALNDGRLEISCEAARAMCQIRARSDDPKPWFYAGLFSLATVDEVKRFLANHHVTKAAIPAGANDEDTQIWLGRVGHETHGLLARLRMGIAQIHANLTKSP